MDLGRFHTALVQQAGLDGKCNRALSTPRSSLLARCLDCLDRHGLHVRDGPRRRVPRRIHVPDGIHVRRRLPPLAWLAQSEHIPGLLHLTPSFVNHVLMRVCDPAARETVDPAAQRKRRAAVEAPAPKVAQPLRMARHVLRMPLALLALMLKQLRHRRLELGSRVLKRLRPVDDGLQLVALGEHQLDLAQSRVRQAHHVLRTLGVMAGFGRIGQQGTPIRHELLARGPRARRARQVVLVRGDGRVRCQALGRHLRIRRERLGDCSLAQPLMRLGRLHQRRLEVARDGLSLGSRVRRCKGGIYRQQLRCVPLRVAVSVRLEQPLLRRHDVHSERPRKRNVRACPRRRPCAGLAHRVDIERHACHRIPTTFARTVRAQHDWPGQQGPPATAPAQQGSE